MKLVRYGPAGREKPGLIDDEGKLRDLSRKVEDIAGDALSPASLNALRKLDVEPPAGSQGPAAPRAVRRQRRQVRRDRPQLRRPREGNRLADPREPDRVLQGEHVDLGTERSDHAAEGLDEHRLGGRARDRHRTARALRRGEGRAALRRRLLHLQRRLRARVPDQEGRRRSGARARAATRSARWARGSSPPTRSAIRRTSRCGSRSTARRGRTAARAR